MDILRTRRLAWAWRCAGVQEAGNLGNGLYVVPAWHNHRLVLGAISRGGGVRSMDYVCKDAVQGLGRGWAAVCGAAGLGCFAVMAQNDAKGLILCQGGGALGNSRMHAEGLNRVGRIVYGCVYCAHRVHSAEQVFGDTDGETDGLCCRCGRPGLPRAQEGQSKIFEDGKCVGSGGVCGNQSVIQLQHFILLFGHCNCLLLGCLWAQHLCYL